MAWEDIPRTHSFSLGDFHDFDSCVFRFFVNHHLQKKYELAEGSQGQAIGSLLDLAIKKLHLAHAYDQPLEYLLRLIRAAENQIREEVTLKGRNSFYGPLPPFLTQETIKKAEEVFASYHAKIEGKFKKMVATQTLKKQKPFWSRIIPSQEPLQLWGGADSIEQGTDGLPEIVDYKYLSSSDQSKEYLDMDLMPKLYTLLCADDLLGLGYKKTRFVIRIWTDPQNNSFYEEFDLEKVPHLEAFFKDKMERILRTQELTFCEKPFCKPCQSAKRKEWIRELQKRGWIKN
jgi:hypothetical protein